MNVDLHPRVFYRRPTGECALAWGYLSLIDGEPWMAGTRQEAAGGTAATMLRLDLPLLSEQRDGETGEQTFLYQGLVPAH
jgi:hypothetical protein